MASSIRVLSSLLSPAPFLRHPHPLILLLLLLLCASSVVGDLSAAAAGLVPAHDLTAEAGQVPGPVQDETVVEVIHADPRAMAMEYIQNCMSKRRVLCIQLCTQQTSAVDAKTLEKMAEAGARSVIPPQVKTLVQVCAFRCVMKKKAPEEEAFVPNCRLPADLAALVGGPGGGRGESGGGNEEAGPWAPGITPPPPARPPPPPSPFFPLGMPGQCAYERARACADACEDGQDEADREAALKFSDFMDAEVWCFDRCYRGHKKDAEVAFVKPCRRGAEGVLQASVAFPVATRGDYYDARACTSGRARRCLDLCTSGVGEDMDDKLTADYTQRASDPAKRKTAQEICTQRCIDFSKPPSAPAYVLFE